VTDKAIYIITKDYSYKEGKWESFWREQRTSRYTFIKTDKVIISEEQYDFYNKLKENKKIKHEKCVFS